MSLPQLDLMPQESLQLKQSAPANAETSDKSPTAFKTISEAATMLGIQQHVLRFWESKFSQIRPLKLKGGRRYYRPQDIETLQTIKELLYQRGYTIKGARKAFSDARKTKQAPPIIARPIAANEAVAVTPPPAPVAKTPKLNKELLAIRDQLLVLRDQLREHTH